MSRKVCLVISCTVLVSVSLAMGDNLLPCTSTHIATAIRASYHCKPIPKVLKLDMPGNGSFTQMTPQFVLANLCGGGCHSPSHSCISTQKHTREVPVLLSTCGLTFELCSKSCAVLVIEEDTSCSCDCLEEQRFCPNSRHRFNSHSCRCECKEEEEYTLCRDQGRLWDNEECVCSCPVGLVKPCSTGFTFDYSSTCSCVPEDSADITNSATDARVERSDAATADHVQHVEIIIIAALGGIVTVFFVIIINLLSSVRTLRSTVRSLREELVRDTSYLSSEQSLLTN